MIFEQSKVYIEKKQRKIRGKSMFTVKLTFSVIVNAMQCTINGRFLKSTPKARKNVNLSVPSTVNVFASY